MRRTVIVTFAVLIALALAWYGYGIGGDADTLRYSLEPVSRGDVESVVVTTGTLEALNTVVVFPQQTIQGRCDVLRPDRGKIREAKRQVLASKRVLHLLVFSHNIHNNQAPNGSMVANSKRNA